MITVATEDELVIPERSDLAFSDNGQFGVSLRASNDHRVLESWTLVAAEPGLRTVRDVDIDRGTNALPLDDGRILLFRRNQGRDSGHGEIILLRVARSDFSAQWLGELPAPLGGYLLPYSSPAECGFVVTLDNPEHSTIWRVSTSPARIEPIVRVPGLLNGGVWLDRNAGILALNQITLTHRSRGISVDLGRGSWRCIWSVSTESNERIVLASPSSRLLIVTSNAAGEERLGWWRLGDAAVSFPETLHRPGYPRQALALDDRGERLLVHEVQGALSRLSVYTLTEDRLETLISPPGAVSAPASWTGELVRFRFSTPCQPPTIASMRLGTHPRWLLSRDPELESRSRSVQASLIEFPGPAGPIEAVVYGGPGWLQCRHLVVALHGGPLSSWRFEFEPLLYRLAVAGVAVVAPNYRGSTGYGGKHLRAVIGSWGVADLEDVLALRRILENQRESRQLAKPLAKPIVLGASYGAFLALLAACAEPASWSACVALAPFLSGPRLHASGSIAVRHRIEQLGGLRNIADNSLPRDVLHICNALSVPLLLMHGIRDETIPVEQSRLLKQRLLELGRAEGVDFEYGEVDRDHTDMVRAAHSEVSQRVVRFCLEHRPLPTAGGKWNR